MSVPFRNKSVPAASAAKEHGMGMPLDRDGCGRLYRT